MKASRSRRSSRRFIWHPISLMVIASRIGAAIFMFVSPVWGYIWTVLFDYIDAIVYLHVLGTSRRQYHILDKNLDLIYFIVMLIIGSGYGLFFPLVILFGYRLLGQYFYLKTGSVTTFVFFPNFFEVVYVWGVLGTITGLTTGLVGKDTLIWLLVLFLLKEAHEISLHWIWARHLARAHVD